MDVDVDSPSVIWHIKYPDTDILKWTLDTSDDDDGLLSLRVTVTDLALPNCHELKSSNKHKPRNPCIKHAYFPILFWIMICCRSWDLLSDQSDMKLIILFIFLSSVKCRASCPPPPGESPPPGCSLTFIQDQGGEIDCQEDEDCPYRWGLPSRDSDLSLDA